MEDDLRRLMVEFCERFKLKNYVRYSNSLTQREINAVNLLGSVKLNDLLNRFGDDYSKIDKEVNKSLNQVSGTGNIEMNGIIKLRKTITDADRNNKITNYLKHNEELFILLTNFYKKTVNEDLVDTIPIPKSSASDIKLLFNSLHMVLTGGKLSMMIHESIHYILEKNGIDFGGEGVSPLNEGFCVFMHFRFNKNIGFYKTGKDELTTDYRRWAGFFENLLKNVPDNEIISTIKKYSITDLQKMMERNEKIVKFRELQENFLRDLIALNNTCDSIKHDINENYTIRKHILLRNGKLTEQDKNNQINQLMNNSREAINKIEDFTRTYEDLLAAARNPKTLDKVFENFITIEVLRTFLKEIDGLSNYLKNEFISEIRSAEQLDHFVRVVKEDVHAMVSFKETIQQMYGIKTLFSTQTPKQLEQQ